MWRPNAFNSEIPEIHSFKQINFHSWKVVYVTMEVEFIYCTYFICYNFERNNSHSNKLKDEMLQTTFYRIGGKILKKPSQCNCVSMNFVLQPSKSKNARNRKLCWKASEMKFDVHYQYVNENNMYNHEWTSQIIHHVLIFEFVHVFLAEYMHICVCVSNLSNFWFSTILTTRLEYFLLSFENIMRNVKRVVIR